MNESDFQETIIDAAHLFGWRVAHFRTVRIARSNGQVYYATPVQADGEGFVDLVLVHPVQKRVLWVEVKSDTGVLSPAQVGWKVLLESANQEWYCWRPGDDWETIELILKGSKK